MRLYLRLLAITVGCTAAALLGLAFLLGGLLGRTLTDLHLQRLSVSVEDTRDTLETGLAWGAPLAAFDSGETLIKRLNDAAKDQTALVIDGAGMQIFPREGAGTNVDDVMLRFMNRIMKTPDRRTDLILPERIVTGATIRTAYGEPAAALILSGGRGPTFAAERAFFLRLAPLFAVVLAVAAALQAIAFAFLLKPVRAYLANVFAMTRRLAGGGADDAGPAEADPLQREFVAAYRHAQERLAGATQTKKVS